MRKSRILMIGALMGLMALPALAQTYDVTVVSEQEYATQVTESYEFSVLSTGIWNAPISTSYQPMVPSNVDTYLANAGVTVGSPYTVNATCPLVGVHHRYATVDYIPRPPLNLITAIVRIYSQACS